MIKGLLRPATTTELAKIIDVDRAAVSRTIHAMEKVGLVECLTPTENRDRYYRTTDTGKKVLAIIEGMEDEKNNKNFENNQLVSNAPENPRSNLHKKGIVGKFNPMNWIFQERSPLPISKMSEYFRNSAPWHLNKSLDELRSMPKQKLKKLFESTMGRYNPVFIDDMRKKGFINPKNRLTPEGITFITNSLNSSFNNS